MEYKKPATNYAGALSYFLFLACSSVCPCEIQEEKSKGVAVHTVVCVCGKMNTLAIRVEK